MSSHPTDFKGNIFDAVRDAIVQAIPDAVVDVQGAGGHFAIVVTSTAFAGKGTLANHKLVLGAIAHLMKGDTAPVHAVDSLVTRVPAAS